MKTKLFFGVLGTIVVLFLIGLGLQELGIVDYSITAPQVQNVQRRVFENTHSYVEGLTQQAAQYRLEYLRAKDDTTKEAIKQTVAIQFAKFNLKLLPKPLYHFVYEMIYSPDKAPYIAP